MKSRLKALLSRLKEKLRKSFPRLFAGLRALKQRFFPAPPPPDLADRFTQIFQANEWRDPTSRSGTGSSLEQTATLRRRLPELLRELKVNSMLDLPCGDFYWMRQVDLPLDRYIGGDIVSALIDANRSAFARPGREFALLNLVEDPLPTVDLIFCRDCLVHLSFEYIWKALSNVKKSGSRYLLTTGFSNLTENRDILSGNWRPLNLTLPPFSFPPPRLVLSEECTEPGAEDKGLFLWEVSQLPSP